MSTTRRRNNLDRPLLEQEDAPQQETPIEKYTNMLDRYIARIDRHKTLDGNPDFKYGFWVAAESRAANREGNYNLARQLKGELAIISSMMGSIQRDMALDVLFTKGEYRNQVINSNQASYDMFVSYWVVAVIKELFSTASVNSQRKVDASAPNRGVHSRELNGILKSARSQYAKRFVMFNNEQIDVQEVCGANENDLNELVNEIRNKRR